jgi:hypothetical protein
MERFTDRDHFMRQRGGGVGHLSTRHCNNTLLQDRHTLLHDNVDVSALDDEAMISHDSGEDDLEDDEGAVDILERDLDEFEGDVDEDLIAAAGFSVL